MEKLIILLISFALMLTGCASAGETLYSVEPSAKITADAMSAEKKAIDVKVYVTNSHDYFENEIDDKCKVFRSCDELQRAIDEVIEPNYDNGIPDRFSAYDEEFFKDKVLLYTAVESSTGSVEFFPENAEAVKQTDKNGKPMISVSVPSRTPEVCTADMAYFCFFCELDKADTEDVPDGNFFCDGYDMDAKKLETCLVLKYDKVTGHDSKMRMNGVVTTYEFRRYDDGEIEAFVSKQSYGKKNIITLTYYKCSKKEFAKLEKIIKKQKLSEWDDYNQICCTEIAESNFSMTMIMDGERVEANGYAAFPDNFNKLIKALDGFVAKLKVISSNDVVPVETSVTSAKAVNKISDEDYASNITYVTEKIEEVTCTDEYRKGTSDERAELMYPVMEQLLNDGCITDYTIENASSTPNIYFSYAGGGSGMIMLNDFREDMN